MIQLGRVPAWLRGALALATSDIPRTLQSEAVPVLDIAQNGVAFAEGDYALLDMNQGNPSQVMFPADPATQRVMLVGNVVNSDASATATMRFTYRHPALAPGNTGYPYGTDVVVPASTTVGLAAFGLPRWLPAGGELTLSIVAPLLTSSVQASVIAYRIPCGFDVMPRGL